MNTYDPNSGHSPEEWLLLDESERIGLIVLFHENSDEPVPENSWYLHASIHCVIENQIALELENVAETVDKLVRQGLSRHEAIHAIGAVFGEDIFAMMKSKMPFNPKQHRRRLSKLTAKRWLKGKY